MVDSNFYVENPSNVSMHYSNKPLVGAMDFSENSPIKRPYNYFEAQALYNELTQDILVKEQHANPERVKKGVPKIIKISLGILAAAPLALMGYKGLQKLIAKFKH